MTNKVLVTGASGLVGSNVCQLLRGEGVAVRGLVRSDSESAPLAELGVELITGDITDASSVMGAADGCDAIIHTAAVLGGADQHLKEHQAVNLDGTLGVFDAGKAMGCRVVSLGTTMYFEQGTLTEKTAITPAPDPEEDPYTFTKRAAHLEGLRRVEAGEDIVIIIPGGIFGTSPTGQRSLSGITYNRLIRAALRGRVKEYVAYPAPWVFAEDVAAASIAAATKGRAGDMYLAFGAEDAMTTAEFLNVLLEQADLPDRVEELRIEANDPDALERYGPSEVELATREYPVPWFDDTYTREVLGYDPVPLPEAFDRTIEWLTSVEAAKQS